MSERRDEQGSEQEEGTLGYSALWTTVRTLVLLPEKPVATVQLRNP